MKSPLVITAALAVASAFSSAAEDPARRGESAFKSKIEPLLVQYCYDCHSDGVEKGDFAFDHHKDYAALRADTEMWDVVRQMVDTHIMPPINKDKPSLPQRDEVVAWIDENVFWFDPAKPDPGHVTYRRLNRTEYNNTVRDTLMLNLRPADEFPQDDTGYGYDNIGDVLSISPLHMEKYLRAARNLAAEAMKISLPERTTVILGAGKFWNHKGSSQEDDGVRWMHDNAEIATKAAVPASGTYRIGVKVAATQAGNEPAKIRLRVNGTEMGDFDIKTTYQKPSGPWQTVQREVNLNAGDNKISIAFINDHYDGANPDPEKRDRNVAMDEAWVDGPFGLTTPRSSRFLNWLLDKKPAGPKAMLISGEDFQKGDGDSELDTGAIQLASYGFVHHPVEIAEPGRHRFVIKAGALQAGDEPAKFDVRIAGKTIGSFPVTAKDQAPQWFTVETDLPVGRHDLQVWFLNDFWDEKTKADRNLWVHEVSVESLTGGFQSVSADDLANLVRKMGARLFRRPLDDAETAKWTAIADAAIKEGEPALGAVGFVLEGMLVSPSFLYRGSPRPAGDVRDGSALIDEFSLASRLSYFLWSAPPDDALLALAAKGELRKNLAAEVRRMIGDWRGYAMTENFAGQWLQLRDMDLVNPSRRIFGDFRKLYTPLKKETSLFFDHILRENRSVIEFLNADYTFANDDLAEFYDLKEKVKGDKFQKVSLKGTPRAGIITHGSILAITSNPTRTNLVKRGKFVLENILGTPPPPAPGDIPPLKEDKIQFEKLTLRQQFEAHRENASCAGCHAFLDPIGFALENYDAVGRWRDKDHGQPVDTAGVLIRGQQFKDWSELRAIIVNDMSGQFVKNLAENLLTYAIGRGPKFYDKPALTGIVNRTKDSGYKFQDMIIAVCESAPFQRMRVEGK